MNKHSILFPRKFRVQVVCVILFLLFMGGCSEPSHSTGTSQPATAAAPILTTQPTASPIVTETLSVAIGQQKTDSGPKVVEQNPAAGERLLIQPVVTIGFDRDMDKRKTEAAFAFSGPDDKTIEGTITWSDSHTLQFQPTQKLEPASSYSASIAASAADQDGKSLSNRIELKFHTVEALIIGQVFPADETIDVDVNTNITVIFNRPVVPVLMTEEQSNLPHPLQFTPQVIGSGEWVNSSVYVFHPDQALISGTRYAVQVDSALKDVENGPISKTTLWHFKTRTPKIGHFSLKKGVQDPRYELKNVLLDQAFVVSFLQPMDASTVKTAFSLINNNTGKPFPVSMEWNKDLTILTILPAGRYALNTTYNLEIATSAQAKGGGCLEKGLTFQFSTVQLPFIDYVQPDSGSEAKEFESSIKIKFGSQMNFESLKSRVNISPKPTRKLNWYYDAYDWQLYINGLDPATEYSVHLLPGMADIYGNTIKTDYSFSFKTGDYSPFARLLVPWNSLVYRSQGKKDIFFQYNNIDSARFSLYRLTSSDFAQLSKRGKDTRDYEPVGDPIREWEPDLETAKNKSIRMKVSLEGPGTKPLKPGYYLLGLNASPIENKQNFLQTALFIIATDNITFKATGSEALAWVVDLETGKPTADVPMTVYNENFTKLGEIKTDKDGIAYLNGLPAPYYVDVENNDHTAFASLDWGSGVSPSDFGIWGDYYGNNSPNFAYMYSDRPLYRPDQEVQFKGIVRRNDDLQYSLPDAKKVYVTIRHLDEQVFADYLPISELGSFSGTFKLARDASLGEYVIAVRYTPGGFVFGNLWFRVAEYHKPEFQVKSTTATPNVIIGDRLNFSLDATYYSGGSLANADVSWVMQTTPYTFSPGADFSRYSFDDWDWDKYYTRPRTEGGDVMAEGEAKTDQNGHLDISKIAAPGTLKSSQVVEFSANVTDIAGNVVNSGTSVIVNLSTVYAGIRSANNIGKQGEAQPFDLVVLDWDSKPVPDQKVSVDFVQRQWFSVQQQNKQGQMTWVNSVKDVPVSSNNQAVTDNDGKAQVSFTPIKGGVYKAIVTVRDSHGYKQEASSFIWVAGTDYIPWQQTNDRNIKIVADKDNYNPGDTAQILITQPFKGDVYALVTYERGHIYKKDVILLHGSSTIYDLPITKEMAPIAYVSVVVVNGAEANGTPDFKMGMTHFNVDTSQQTLDVRVSADKKTSGPGDKITYTIQTRDMEGNPVSAEASLALVDKAALALVPANSAPILTEFYSEQGLSVRTSVGIVLSAEDFNANYESKEDGKGSGGGGGDSNLGIITVRKNFKDTAYFSARVMTGQQGKAQVEVTLPDNLTTWVADVRAFTEDSRVGQGTSELITTKLLYVEMKTPRFFVSGDTAQVGAVIHNNTVDPMTVNVTLDAKGVDLQSLAGKVVTVEGKQQAYVTWDLTVKKEIERVDFKVDVSSDALKDTSTPALGTLSGQGIPVYNFTVAETVGTSGMLTRADSITEAFQLPAGYHFDDASLSVEVSLSLASSLTGGLTYLEQYPYLCLEQTISRFLPNVLTTRVLKAAGQSSVSLQKNLDDQVNEAMQRITAKQNADGGWAWWDNEISDPQTSAYVILGLLEAKRAGYSVSENVFSSGIEYLKQNIPAPSTFDTTWKYNREAFILYVLADAGELDTNQSIALYDSHHELSLFGKAYLAQAIYLSDKNDPRIKTLMSDLNSNSILSAAGAHWKEKFVDYWNWNSDVRTTAIVLGAYIKIDPENPITANAVRWLMANRTSGHWASTQETAWTLMSITNWLVSSKEFEANYPYAIGLNGTLQKSAAATKENLANSLKLTFSQEDLLERAANYLVISRGAGQGNMYYSAYMNAKLPVESIRALDQGMTITRQYFRLDSPKTPVTEIKQGELVRVRLTLVVPDAVHNIYVNDPLPAGLEAIDSSIKTDMKAPTSYSAQDYSERGWGWWYFDHTELRDEKVVLAAQYLPPGTYVYTYLARASSVGAFNVIPPTAAEFYFPDVAGRGDGSIFTVKP